MKLIIGNKEYELKISMHALEKINEFKKKLNLDKIEDDRKFVFYVLSLCLKKRFWLAPFVAFFPFGLGQFFIMRKLKKMVSLSEYNEIVEKLINLLKGIDETSGNSSRPEN